MSGSSVFAFGSTAVSNAAPAPPAWSLGSAITEWTLLGGWTSGLFMVNVTALALGPGQAFTNMFIGLCPIDPATGEWIDTYTPSGGQPILTTDGGVIKVITFPREYAINVPLAGNAYEVVMFANAGTTATLSASLIVHD